MTCLDESTFRGTPAEMAPLELPPTEALRRLMGPDWRNVTEEERAEAWWQEAADADPTIHTLPAKDVDRVAERVAPVPVAERGGGGYSGRGDGD